MENNMSELAIKQTKLWLEQIIIGLNFCPFAKKEFVNNTIDYYLDSSAELETALENLAKQLALLERSPEIETSLLIYDQGFSVFDDYLDLVDYGNELLVNLGYEGIFQLASFHPDYCFEGELFEDAANFTNRSPYPTLHIIREQSMEKVLALYKEPEKIPENNIALAQAKGNHFFEALLKRIKASKKS